MRSVPPGVRRDRSRLSPPKRHPNLCDRENLLEHLERALRAKATLIIGPAGYGKTTLIAQWCERLTRRSITHAYYSCSERDREPISFLSMLAAALENAGINVTESLVRSDIAVQPEAVLDEILLRLDRANQTVALFIDEFEQVEDPAINRVVETLIRDASPNIHIVIGSRRRPSIPLSDLEARNDVHVIDTTLLRLSIGEMASILGLPEGSSELAEIAELTEGWAVTVQLYRLWLERHRMNLPRMRIGGQIDEVKHYLTEQLLSSLPTEQIDLLKDIASLDEVESELVDIMRGRSDSARLLESAATNLSSLMWNSEGEHGRVYRLHPLLLHHLRDSLAGDQARRCWLSANAAAWYLHRHRFPDAVRSALASGRHETIEQVFHRLRPIHLFLAEGASALRDVLRHIPDERLSEHPRLRIMAAIAHFKAGFFLEAKTMLEHIRAATDEFQSDPDGEPSWLIAEGYFAEIIFMGQISRFTPRIDALYQKIVATAGDDPILWGACENAMILVAQHRGDLQAAKNSIVRTRRIYETAGLTRYAHLQIIGQELLVALAEGGLRRASNLIAGYRRGASLTLHDDMSIPAMLKIILAAIRYETEFDDQAVEMLQTGLAEHGASESLFDQYAITYPCVLTRLFLRQGSDAVFDALAAMRERALRTGIEALPRFLDFLEIEYLVRSGNLIGAGDLVARVALEDFVRDCHRLVPTPPWRERDAGAQALCLFLLADGRSREAAIVARNLADDGQRGGRLRTEIKGLTLQALATRGTIESSAPTLHKAVLLAYPENIVAPFAEEGEAIRPVIAALRADDQLDAYARRHLQAIERAILAAMPRADASEINDREREILAYLAEGASNKVIARRMGVTDNTVKFHLKKIFAKLNVSTRRAAVAKVAGA